MSQKTIEHLSVRFHVQHQIENLQEFQAGGHSVPAQRRRDAEGNLTQQPRDWQGSEVHAFSLCYPTEPHQVATLENPFTGKTETFCRVVADTADEAAMLMFDAVRSTVFTLKHQAELATFHAEQLRKSTDQRTRLMNWMISHGHGAELSEALGETGVKEALAEVLNAESDPVMRKTVETLLRGGMA